MAEQTQGSARQGFVKIKAWIKSHPYEAGALALVVVLVLVWYHFSKPRPVAAAPQQGGTDQATLQAELQQEAINAQQTTALQSQQQAAAVAENQNQTLLNYGSIQAGETLGLAQILADIQSQQITTQGSVDMASIAANRDISFNNATTWLQGQTIGANVALAGISANQNIASNNAATWLQGQSLAATAAVQISQGQDVTAALISGNAPAGATLQGPLGGASIVGNYPSPNQLQAEGFTAAQINNYLMTGHAY